MSRSLAVRILGDKPRTIPMTVNRTSDSDGGRRICGDRSRRQRRNGLLLRLDGERERPDPVSRWQPQGVHRPSRIVDPNSFRWSDQAWKGIPLKDFIIYELHTGTFTPEGTFESIIPRLSYLRERRHHRH